MTMSKQDIIDMAEKAGFNVGQDSAGEYVAPQYKDSIGTLERFAALVGFRVFEVEQEQCAAKVVAEGVAEYERGLKDGALLEREACAKVCDDESEFRASTALCHDENSHSRDRCYSAARAATKCATTIRARSEAKP